ncbi:hypothetical protein Tco_0776277 [Tanacetum coccineum]
MTVANSRKHHCRVRPYTREVLEQKVQRAQILNPNRSITLLSSETVEEMKQESRKLVRIADYISTFKLFGLLYQPRILSAIVVITCEVQSDEVAVVGGEGASVVVNATIQWGLRWCGDVENVEFGSGSRWDESVRIDCAGG